MGQKFQKDNQTEKNILKSYKSWDWNPSATSEPRKMTEQFYFHNYQDSQYLAALS